MIPLGWNSTTKRLCRTNMLRANCPFRLSFGPGPVVIDRGLNVCMEIQYYH